MKKLYVATSLQDAKIIQDLLKQRGFDTEMRGAALSSTLGQLPIKSLRTSLWIKKSDYDKAFAVISEIKTSENQNKTPWECKNCGEEIEGQFLECWNCSTEKVSQYHK